MQEDTSSRGHDAEQLLFRTKDHGPSRGAGVVADGVPDGVPDEPAGEVDETGDADGAEGPDGPDGPGAAHGAAPVAGGHGGFGALGMFKNLLPVFGAPLAAAATGPAVGEPPGLAMPPQSPLPLNAAAEYAAPRIAPVTFVANKYVLLDKVDGSSFFNCIDIHTREQLVCKVVGREAGPLLSAHFRVDGHPGLNPLREVMLGPHAEHTEQQAAHAHAAPGSRHTYLIFPAAHGDLHTHVRTRRRLRDSEARRLFRQMAECVRHCHEAGIVLRDLKLRKFVFTDRQRTTLKLESLEDAVVLDSPEDDLLQDKRGCPAYVSPEILRSHAQYSGRAADMWSLGVILYTTLVGRYPFNDTEHASLFAKISRGHYVMPEWLSHKARCLIRSLLRRDPSERLTAEDVLRHPWLLQDRDHGQGRHGDDAAADLHHLHHQHHGLGDSASDQLVPDVM